ncbi:MAG: hypothetical protein ABEH65_09070 [Halobacteriales archaeon]
MTDTDNSLMAYLAANPRMIGVLFTLMVLVMEAGNVAARGGGTISGP